MAVWESEAAVGERFGVLGEAEAAEMGDVLDALDETDEMEEWRGVCWPALSSFECRCLRCLSRSSDAPRSRALCV